MNDRSLGYIIIVCICAAFLATGGYLANLFLYPPEKRLFVFNNIGNLQIDDLLKVQGVPAGRISNILDHDKRVLVTITMRKHIPIYANYHVILAEKGILGERFLVLEPGDDRSPALTTGDTVFAIFAPGIAEIIGQAWKLEPAIQKINARIEEMLYGTAQSPALVDRLQDIFRIADSMSLRVQSAADVLRHDVSEQLDTLEGLVSLTRDEIEGIAVKLPQGVGVVDSLLQNLAGAIASLDRLTLEVQSMTTRVANKESILWDDSLMRLRSNLEKLESILREISAKAARLRLRISFER
jgi:phospholipid/cholesterol/gamma-HCH transport system substrate-binding protein